MAISKLGMTYARNAGADLSAKLYFLAHIDTDGDLVLAGNGEHVIGVITEAAAQNKPVTVQFTGIAKCVCGAAVTAGERVASDAAGKCVPATATEFEFGTALESGSADEIIPVALIPGRAAA